MSRPPSVEGGLDMQQIIWIMFLSIQITMEGNLKTIVHSVFVAQAFNIHLKT